MTHSSLHADVEWRAPAATLGEMPRAGLTIPADTPVPALEHQFLRTPALSSVVVSGMTDGPVCITRGGFFAALTGPLGYGRSLYARQRVRDLPRPDTLLVDAETTIAAAAQAVLDRPDGQRYDDFVVCFDDGAYGTLCVAELFAELAHTHAFQALHDALTGLPNRRLFLDRVHSAQAGDDRLGTRCAVLFVDVDDFKTINDGLGHDVGDRALSIVAARLRDVLGPDATVGRFGGDEFGVLLADAGDRGRIRSIAERVALALARPLRVGDETLALSASVGVAVNEPGSAAEDLIRNADLAMYAAKRTQKGSCTFYDDGMHARARDRLELRSGLERALERGEFFLAYQPVVDLARDKVIGAEALLRWRRPDEGVVAPDHFIPLCEESGLIVPIGRWVLREACRQAMEWTHTAPRAEPLRVGVNISPRQLQEPAFVAAVAAALRESGLAAHRLVLEITEGVFIHDTEEVLRTLVALKQLGVCLALDDFGSGFSSLGYLSRMPIDDLKLDRAFVARLGEPDERGLVAGIVALARSLGLTPLAEGVEDAEQLRALRAAGCALAQGYYLGRPGDPAEVVRLAGIAEAEAEADLAPSVA